MSAAMILAAGRGERLRPVTDRVPKALVEVRGEKLIDRHLAMLAAGGIRRVVINLGWLGERIVEHVGGGDRFGLSVVYSPEYDAVLETGGGICRALPLLGDQPFWTVNGDVWTDFALPDVPLRPANDAELVVVPRPPHRPRGDFDLAAAKIRNGPDPAYTFSGIARYRPAFFRDAGTGRFSVVPLMRAAADEGRLGGLLFDGTWHDIGTPERLAALNRQ